MRMRRRRLLLLPPRARVSSSTSPGPCGAVCCACGCGLLCCCATAVWAPLPFPLPRAVVRSFPHRGRLPTSRPICIARQQQELRAMSDATSLTPFLTGFSSLLQLSHVVWSSFFSLQLVLWRWLDFPACTWTPVGAPSIPGDIYNNILRSLVQAALVGTTAHTTTDAC
jgi:hypothetical protein